METKLERLWREKAELNQKHIDEWDQLEKLCIFQMVIFCGLFVILAVAMLCLK